MGTFGIVYGLLGLASGLFVGFSLGLVGGGGSILAVPLMVYLVGVPDAHVAIGTSAIAVAANAAFNLATHARNGTVKWHCAGVFAGLGAAGAVLGSTIGKNFDGQRLLALFACLMIVITALMLSRRNAGGTQDGSLNRGNLPKLVGYGLGAGTVSSFFGIGGGFLVVPGLVFATACRCSMRSALSCGSDGVRADHRRQLCVLGLCRLAARSPLHRRRSAGRIHRRALGQGAGASARRAQFAFAGIIFVIAVYMLVRSSGGL